METHKGEVVSTQQTHSVSVCVIGDCWFIKGDRRVFGQSLFIELLQRKL